jgi:hypothetical protein
LYKRHILLLDLYNNYKKSTDLYLFVWHAIELLLEINQYLKSDTKTEIGHFMFLIIKI